MSTCQKLYSASSSTADRRAARISSFRSSRARPWRTFSSPRPSMAATAPDQNTLPNTAAAWSWDLLGLEGIQAGRDQGLHRLRQLGRVAVSGQQLLVGEQAHELLGVQRVAAGPFQEQRLGLRRQHRPAEQRAEQRRGLLVVEGGQRQGDRLGAAGPPAGAPVEQLGPGRHHDQQVRRAVQQLLDEVEQGRVGPVQVLDHQDQGALPGDQVEEPPPGHEGLLPAGRPLGDGREADQRGQSRLQPLAVGGVAGHRADGRVQLGRDLRGVVGLHDAGLGLDDLPQGPEADRLPVGHALAPPPGHQLRLGVDKAGELPHQPALADPGYAEHGDQPRGMLAERLPVAASQRRQFLVAADQRGRRPLGQIHAGRLRAASTRQIGTGSALPLTWTGASRSYSNNAWVARQVASPTTTPLTGATPWSRAAVLTTSPTTPSLPAPRSSATSASPVLTPIRTASSSVGWAWLSSAIASSMRSAHRTARSGSSSWTAGTPNTAMTASPISLSRVPPARSISPRRRA